MRWTFCGGAWASTPPSAACWRSGGSTSSRPSGCCSRWWPTGRWPPPPSWPRPAGSPTTWPSTGFGPSPRTPATGRLDALLDVEDALARRVYDAVADLLNLEVDLLFFDTTSTYFEL